MTISVQTGNSPANHGLAGNKITAAVYAVHGDNRAPTATHGAGPENMPGRGQKPPKCLSHKIIKPLTRRRKTTDNQHYVKLGIMG
ncbi:hypothetical protein [Nocardia sp. NPDC056000]|uniref:hypothetical protein n=1 Tax=Nocardia sp. NPDC056000 TaxID=3345674 RepID=UPI0035E3A226